MAITQATQLADFTSGIGTAGAILEVDNVSNKIGIGTTNPQALLQVGQIIKMDGPSGIITATTFSGNFTGNITGNATGLSGTPDITVNNIIGVGATFTGEVTYEDVTNIDSIGIVTARSGIHVDDSITHISDTNTKIRFPSADTFTVETSGVERLRVGSTGTVGVAGLSTATSFGAFNHLSAPFGGGTVSYTVTVASKTADHRYNGSGSGNAYLIDGVQSPFLTLTPGRTYRFVHDNTGSHPLKFYLEADKTTLYSTGVTFDNAYTEIVVSDSTPQVLHYQCTNHSLMGNAVQTNSNIGGGFNVVDESSDTSCNVLFTTDATGTALAAKSGTNLTFNSSSGALTATSFVGALTGAVTGNADTATNASGLTGTPNISCGTGAFSGVVTLQNNLDLQDNDVILIGTGDDLQINHDSSNSFIANYTGTFVLRNYADDSDILLSSDDSSGGTADYVRCDGSVGSVILSHYGSTKFETKAYGAFLTGNLGFQDDGKLLLGTGDDLEIYHDGTDSKIDSGAPLKIKSTGGGNDITVTSADDFIVKVNGSEDAIKCTANTSVELYHNGTKKFETSATGVTVTGTLNATTALTQDGKGLATTGKAIAMAMVFG